MNSLYDFLLAFFKNKGHHVFYSLLIAKICAFLGSLFIIRILPENEFGTITIVASVFFIFNSFNGFGSNQILLRYGSIAQSDADKTSLSKYLLKQGLIYQFIISIVFFSISVFYVNKYEDSLVIFLLFSFRLLGLYFLNHIQIEYRVFGNNRIFAQINNVVNVLGLIFTLLMAYYFGLIGYLIAISFSPFICLFWLKKKNNKAMKFSIKFEKKEMWNYGFYAVGAVLLSDILFSLDVLLLSFFMNENDVAYYKVGLLIPFNVTFLAATFMQSDFTVFAENSRNKLFLRNYIANYYKLFIPISSIIFISGFFLKNEILNFFFSSKYTGSQDVFIIFLGTFTLNMLLRNLYGTLLSAVGRIKISSIISAITVFLLLIFSFVFVDKYGVVGMAISLSLSLLICGVLLMFSFFNYWKNLK